ncbi:CU044_2847 family protein [Streptomyces piniterrae]|uniref:CU044_2847 family protein n=1 Tax=Streptomyces piniterrae TaxID=2571125 RepID=UPI001FE8710D|nr:CU044_2847 family protein [Streptomyces piniterrae]
MQDRAQQITLPDGTEVWARVSRLDAPGLDGGTAGGDGGDGEFEDVGAWDALGARVEGLREVIGGVAASVRQAAAGVAPHETSVTFGVELSAKPGKAVALLADGEAKANLSVTLTWRREDRAPAPGEPAPAEPAPGEPAPAATAPDERRPAAGPREPDDSGR